MQLSSGQKSASTLYVLQACRGLACLMVVVYHGVILVGNWYGIRPLHNVYNFGYSGVHLFFVISGFIIYHVHYHDSDHALNIPHYLIRRIVRIYPLYWLVFFVWGGWRVFAGRFDAYDFISNALFFSSDKKLVVPVSWTLAHEMVFYCLFALFIANRKMGYAVFGGWLTLLFANHLLDFSTALPARLPNVLFVIGLAASLGFRTLFEHLGQAKREYVGAASLVLGGLLFLATIRYCSDLSGGRGEVIDVWGNALITLGFGLASALVLLSSLSDQLEGYLKNKRLPMLLGNASYSIYLVHFYIQRMAFNITKPVAFIWSAKSQAFADLLLLFVVLVPVAAGIVIHQKIEKPILATLRNLLKKTGN